MSRPKLPDDEYDPTEDDTDPLFGDDEEYDDDSEFDDDEFDDDDLDEFEDDEFEEDDGA